MNHLILRYLGFASKSCVFLYFLLIVLVGLIYQICISDRVNFLDILYLSSDYSALQSSALGVNHNRNFFLQSRNPCPDIPHIPYSPLLYSTALSEIAVSRKSLHSGNQDFTSLRNGAFLKRMLSIRAKQK
uniref:Uncharacterized protein n=1 Tax=Cacopsylla melanoneura TaxID=428564 RepID=A0A8D8Q0D5_9HEMI